MKPDVFAEIQGLVKGVRGGPWQTHAQQLLEMAKCWMLSRQTNGDDLLNPDVIGDFGDCSEAHTRRFDDQAKKNLAQAQLGQVLTALQRIRQGIYGTCENCGKTIPTERLEAMPDATRCVVCQQALAKKKNR